MSPWRTAGPSTPGGESKWRRWTKWAALAFFVVAAAVLGAKWMKPESDDMREFKADWEACRKSDSAEAQLRACTRLMVSGWVSDRSLPDVYNNSGMALWRLDRYEQAITAYDVAIQLNPRHELAYVNRGNSYAFLNKDDLAIADYTRALEINPNDDFAYMNRATTHYIKGNYRQAIQDYDQAVRLKPGDAGLLVRRGHVWRKLGEDKKADADFAAARAIDPKIDSK